MPVGGSVPSVILSASEHTMLEPYAITRHRAALTLRPRIVLGCTTGANHTSSRPSWRYHSTHG
jgi:hypothetical protein